MGEREETPGFCGEPIDRWRLPPTEPHYAPRSVDRLVEREQKDDVHLAPDPERTRRAPKTNRSLKTLDRGRRFTEGFWR